MDFKAFVDCIDAMTCIMSVEMNEDGSYGDIRIVAGNKAYIDSIENPPPNVPTLASTEFIPGSLYQVYFPKDLNFERMCYSAAVLKKPFHSYIHPERFDFWFNLFCMPLVNEGNIYYCTYTQEVTREAETDKMVNVSKDSAESVLSTCVKLKGAKTTEEFKQKVQSVIEDLRDICGSENCCIMLMDEENQLGRPLAESRVDNATLVAVDDVDDDEFFEIAKTWYDTIGGSNCLIIKNADDMKYIEERNPAWYRSLTSAKVNSIILFPLKANDELIGYIWATNFDVESEQKIKETLELSTFFIAAEISNHLLLNKLKRMSSVDMLTGVLNRNEMNNRIEDLKNGKGKLTNPGIVFADLNSLKKINDTDGHFAGDQVLKDAAFILQDVFAGEEIYRAGGDEFMVIVKNADDARLAELCNALKQKAAKTEHVSFAAGYSSRPSSVQILEMLHEADENMYKDKEKFYQENPGLKRA